LARHGSHGSGIIWIWIQKLNKTEYLLISSHKNDKTDENSGDPPRAMAFCFNVFGAGFSTCGRQCPIDIPILHPSPGSKIGFTTLSLDHSLTDSASFNVFYIMAITWESCSFLGPNMSKPNVARMVWNCCETNRT
jgi:hypothetical protein